MKSPALMAPVPIHHQPKIKRLIVIAVCILLLITSLNVVVSYLSTIKTARIAIATQGIEMAKSIADSLDKTAYSQFLQNPTYSEQYWSIRNQLNEARQKIGALYVYTLQIDNPEVSKALIVGVPQDDPRFPIGEECTVPAKQVQLAFEGKTYYTKMLVDPKYGKYLSVGAPIVDQGQRIGYVGIDLSFRMLKQIKEEVVHKSISTFIFNAFFVIFLLAAYTFLQKWYQRELKLNLAETEQTYQKEVESILMSVKSIRHDFSNHIQVLYGLIDLNYHDQAMDYMKGLVQELNYVDLSLTVRNPALLVLLQTKWVALHNKKIDFIIDVDNDTFENIPATDLIKILSNLIDNAKDAALEHPSAPHWVQVTCTRDVHHYVLEVANTGNMIPEQDRERIFAPGYSTKDHQKRGHGLGIVKTTVHKYSGKLIVESTPRITRFRAVIPIPGQ